MKRNKVLKKTMTLVLAAALLLGSGSSALAGEMEYREIQWEEDQFATQDCSGDCIREYNRETEQVSLEAEQEKSQEEQDHTALPEDTGDAGTTGGLEKQERQQNEQKIQEDSSEAVNPEEEHQAADPQEEEKNQEKEQEKDQEGNPADTPYQELLAEENLIIVTVEQGSGDGQEEMAVETLEELSDGELQALEEYIEDQGYPVSTAAMLDAASDTQVRTITFNMNGFISLAAEGYGTGYDAMFYVNKANCQGNGNAYCIDPSKQAPGHSDQGREHSYTTTVRDYRDPLLLKIMYYGFGGPGDITGSFAQTNPARHILTHLVATRRAAELGIPGAGNYKYSANSTAIARADALYEAIKGKKDILGRVSVLTPVQGQQTIMLLAEYSVPPEKPKETELSVAKTVTGTAGNKNTAFHFRLTLTAENGISLPDFISCSQNGREFTLQKEAESTKKTAIYSFTLEHDQRIIFRDLPVGVKYQVQETDGEGLGYTVTSENAKGTLTEKAAEVSFRNSKEMIVPTGADPDQGRNPAVLMLASIVLLWILFENRRKGCDRV
ncbi:MAG: DUF5979 domain-containing protein [Lachnospiraceae bacterium]|nr:DUF5979 domain-containing protein [Lachnospiraceae bacterium]